MSKINSATSGDDHLALPYEKSPSDEKSVEENLFDLLGSDPEFADEEQPDEADESASDEEEDESDQQESNEEEDESEEEEDEDESTEETEESEDEEESEEAEDEDSDDDEPERRKVKVQGEVVAEVTFDEAIAGYSRTEDYTRKRQADVATHTAEMAEASKARELYSTRLDQVAEAMKGLTPPEPDWDKLRKDDPAEYAAQRADFDARERTKERVEDERKRVSTEKAEELGGQLKIHLQGEMAKLVDVIPEWQDEEARTEGLTSLRSFAQEAYGFTEDDLENVVDHRLLLMLRENQEARQKTKSGKKQIREKSKGARKMKPGSSSRKSSKQASSKKKVAEAARGRLAQTGRVDDAAAAIEAYLDD